MSDRARPVAGRDLELAPYETAVVAGAVEQALSGQLDAPLGRA
jgi:hypothetical protein